jgi:hypothetical protein
VVRDVRAGVAFHKGVLVLPEAVWTAYLLIHKTVWRLPRGDFAFSSDRNSSKLQAILDVRSASHQDWRGRDDVEVKKWRGQQLQIAGFSKEREYGVDWNRKV